MKKFLTLLTLILALACIMASCGEEKTETTTSPAHTHTFDQWVTESEPSCYFLGQERAVCECGEKSTELRYTKSIHESKGYKDEICDICGVNVALDITVTSTGKWGITCNSKDVSEIIIPSKIDGRVVEAIEDDAFKNCAKLTSITIPESVTEIGSYAFADCESLTNVIIPESVTEIKMYAFKGCKSLTSVIIPESVTEIQMCAFEGCKSLTSVIIPESVTEIAWGAFEGCTALKSIIIPDSVEKIERSAFENCTRLKTVYIGSGLLEIENRAFYGCQNLTTVYTALEEDDWNAVIGVDNIPWSAEVYKWNR